MDTFAQDLIILTLIWLAITLLMCRLCWNESARRIKDQEEYWFKEWKNEQQRADNLYSAHKASIASVKDANQDIINIKERYSSLKREYIKRGVEMQRLRKNVEILKNNNKILTAVPGDEQYKKLKNQKSKRAFDNYFSVRVKHD